MEAVALSGVASATVCITWSIEQDKGRESIKSARPHRQGSAQKRTEKREALKQLVYKIDAYTGEEVIYASLERGVFHSRVKHALEDSTTWAEFRHAMPRQEYSRLLHELFDKREGYSRPRASDPFDMSQIPGAGDCDYPGWLQQEMLEGVLPVDILEKYGQYGESFVSGPCVSIRPDDLDEVNAELERRGYELIDGSGLYLEG